MATFLAWLYSIASAVYDWFNSQYWNAVYTLRNIVQWVNSWIATAVTNVEAWARAKFDDFTSWVNTLWDGITDWINSVYASIVDWVNGTISTVYTAIHNVESWLSQSISNGLQGLNDWINATIDNVVSWFVGAINDVSTRLTDAISPLQPLYSKVSALIALTDNNIFSRLITIGTDLFDTLLLFFNNPVGFIYSHLEATVIDWLQELIAYALGTQDNPLPPRRRY